MRSINTSNIQWSFYCICSTDDDLSAFYLQLVRLYKIAFCIDRLYKKLNRHKAQVPVHNKIFNSVRDFLCSKSIGGVNILANRGRYKSGYIPLHRGKYVNIYIYCCI